MTDEPTAHGVASMIAAHAFCPPDETVEHFAKRAAGRRRPGAPEPARIPDKAALPEVRDGTFGEAHTVEVLHVDPTDEAMPDGGICVLVSESDRDGNGRLAECIRKSAVDGRDVAAIGRMQEVPVFARIMPPMVAEGIPAPGGLVQCPDRDIEGSIGVFVTTEGNRPAMVSAAHVFGLGYADLVPGIGAVTSTPNGMGRIGSVTDAVRWRGNGPFKIDAAVVEIDRQALPRVFLSPESGVPDFRSVGTVKGGMTAKRWGARTGSGVGIVRSSSASVRVSYAGAGSFVFWDQITVDWRAHPTADGDSGCPVTDDSDVPIGLHIAGNGSEGVANHMSEVLAFFGLSLM